MTLKMETLPLGWQLGLRSKSFRKTGFVPSVEPQKSSSRRSSRNVKVAKSLPDSGNHAAAKRPNRLVNEKSPYLQQHAYNPVDWFAWGEEAFDKAMNEDKPVFLSIGYSTCHWCHVMERESFEDKEVAELLNTKFVPVKVDREERPDIDSIYMQVCVSMTGKGGWPLTVVVNPQKQPFFAGTYFPKESRNGMMGIIQVLQTIAELWKKDRQKLLVTAEKAEALTRERVQTGVTAQEVGEIDLDEGYLGLLDSYDNSNGGFGTSPKFPSPHNLMFLLRYFNRKQSAKALEMVEKTLRKMRLGGIFDHLGFGFHRYSTDSSWLVPHFEKMLYDQAMLCMTYTEAYQATGREEYKKTSEEILTYILREMASPEGGFYSAEDADSEGQEGKYYTWTRAEVVKALGSQAETFCKVFNVSDNGSFVDPLHETGTGANILHLEKPLEEIALEVRKEPEELRDIVEKSRTLLLRERQKRIRPLKDTKILTDWNGLMIVALAKSAQAIGSDEYASIAEKASNFILKNLRQHDGRLFHRYKDGEAAIQGMANDYAFLVWGLTELYETTFKIDYLRKACELQDIMIEDFWDEESCGFFFTSKRAERILFRNRELDDGAVPSGSSVALFNLIRLARLVGRADYEEKARAFGRAFRSLSRGVISWNTMFLIAVDFLVGPTHEIVVVGRRNSTSTHSMLTAVSSPFLPRKTVFFKQEGDETAENLVSYVKDMKMLGSRATAYVCRDQACIAPLTDVDRILGILSYVNRNDPR